MKTKTAVDCLKCVQVKELEILFEIARLMAAGYEVEKKLNEALRLLKSYLSLERCTVYALDAEKQELFVLASDGLTFKQKMIATYKVGEGATGVAAQSREPVVIENIHNSVLFLNKTGAANQKDISYVAVPMIADDEVVGVLSANLTTESVLDFEETVKILTIVCSIFAQSMAVDSKQKDEKAKLSDENIYYKTEILAHPGFSNIIGTSAQMKEVFTTVNKIALTKATVLIRGETGTGKELVAASIHSLSPRANGPFVKLNCAAIAETLLESELFGHEKGAFTDAKEMRKGRFELADKGTLFLDEIGDISASLQVKLLRVLQEQEFERVGGSKTIKVDVRLVAATNRNLEEMITTGEFREDLFYRLNVIPLNLPPLRERGEDVLLLVHHFADKFCRIHKKTLEFSQGALQRLLHYPWPGNIRELENTMERIVLLSESDFISDEVIAALLPSLDIKHKDGMRASYAETVTTQGASKLLGKKDLELLEKEAIIKALFECKGVQAQAAKKLGLTTRQIGYKIQKYDIEV